MSSFYLLLAVTFGIFILARIMKDHRVYVALMAALTIGLILGLGMKEAKASNMPSKTMTITNGTSPMLQSLSTAIVDDVVYKDNIVAGQDTIVRDTLVIDIDNTPTMPTNCEINDDS